MQSTRSKSLPFVLKDTYLQVVVKGEPFALNSSHPTFERMKRALKKKNWAAVPRLISVAKAIESDTSGNVSIVRGQVFYKGKAVNSSLTKRMLAMIKEQKEVKHLLRFMDNLYKNPSEDAVREFYDWLMDNDLPITDDGCFLAYKSVKHNNTDTHTGKINNSPGQIIMGSRKWFNQNYRTQCSTGFHICSKQYGVYGDKTMAVKANPRHVLSAEGGKIRVTQYEVLMELGSKNADLFKLEGFSDLEKKLVIDIKSQRREMIEMLLSLPSIKRSIKNRKMSKTSIMKSSFARLKTMIQKYDLVPKVGPEDKKFLQAARKAAGLTVGQIAKKMEVGYKQVAKLEEAVDPNQGQVNSYLEAIATLTKISHPSRSAITYPKPMAFAV